MDHDAAGQSAERDPLVGRDIQGRYRILKRLGAGGMGTVYLGEHLMIKRKVAIKTLHAQFAIDPTVVQRFHREALAAASIGNEHIVEVTDMGRFEDGALYMVLEHLDGSDLGQQIEEQGAQTLGRITRIMLQLCDALSAVHDKGIVHRDLKPDNIFLIRRGDNPDFVKVLDFGISKFKTSLDDSGAKMTATGATLGTPYFMSPEQVLGQPDVDHRADIYALGTIMYYALCGRHPFEATNVPTLFMKICSEEPPPLCSIRSDLPAEVERIVHRALSRSPHQRFAHVAELKQALLPFQHEEAAPPSELAFDRTQVATSTPSSGAAPARSGAGTGAQPKGESLAGATHSVADEPRPTPQRGLRTWPVLMAAAVVVGGAGVWLALGSGALGATGRSTASVDSEPSASLTKGEVDPDAETVRVTVTTEPEDAELLLDGHPVANPFDADLPKTEEPRTVEARLEGCEPVKKELVLMYPQTVRLKLKPVGPQVAPASDEASLPAGKGRARPGATVAAPSRKAKAEVVPAAAAKAEPRQEPVAAAPVPPQPAAAAPVPPAPAVTATAAPKTTSAKPTSTTRKLKSPF